MVSLVRLMGNMVQRGLVAGMKIRRIAVAFVAASFLALFAIATKGQGVLQAGTGSGGAVYRSADGGSTWQLVNTGLTSQSVTALAIDPVSSSTIYVSAGTNEISAKGGVFKTTDGGGSWRAINTGLDPDATGSVLVIDPKTPTTIYLGSDRGVFKSSDAGGEWHAANAGLSYPIAVNALVIDPQTPTILYAATMSGVFKTADGGTGWRALDLGLGPYIGGRIAIDVQNPNILYAAVLRTSWSIGGLFKSTDGGEHWRPINPRLADVKALSIDARMPTTLYAGDLREGMFKSTDGGGHWHAINAGLPTLRINALMIDPQMPSTLYAGFLGGGVFKSVDGGGNWQTSNAGLADLRVWAMAIDPKTPTTLYAGTYSVQTYTVSLERIGVAFDLPKGFVVFQRESQSPYYATVISFGKEFRTGHLKNTPLQIEFSPTAYDGTRTYAPSQFVDVEYERVKENVRKHAPGYGPGPEYTKLFGNKAVRYSAYGQGGYMFIIGFIRADQLPQRAGVQVDEYLVKITSTFDSHLFLNPDERYQDLFDAVVNSLRIMK